MNDATYKVIELVGTSGDSVQQAIRNGIDKASETIRGIDWFEVQNIRGRVENGAVSWFQVDMKIGFRVLSAEELHQDLGVTAGAGIASTNGFTSGSPIQE